MGLLRVEFKVEGGAPFAQLFQTRFRFGFTLEPDHEVVGVSHYDHVTFRSFPPPLVDP
jgi:hypothetical protein